MDSGTIQNYYRLGEQYFNQMGFPATWKQCTEFKNGKQWPPPTEKTKNMPRPVINIIRFIENHKTSQILSEPIKMIFSKEEIDLEATDGVDMEEVGAELFTQFSSQEWENIKQDGLNEEALDKASELCSGIYHYYFDDSVIKGKKNIVKGVMKGEILHPLSVMIGNPQNLDTQMQPYILIPVRDDIENIKKRAKDNGVKVEDIAQIVGDKDVKDTSNNAKFEIKDKATEITCYYKENGTIWLMKTCGTVVTKPPVDTLHKLYPIARMNWYKEDKNWYGIGETEGLITNQKSINFMTATQMMRETLMGMPKLMLKKQYVKGFNNDPATPIMDDNPTGWSAQYLQPPNQSGKGQELVDFLLTASKTHSGSTETATGELAKSSQMNATAIMMLQKASAVPLDQIKKRFKRVMEEIGQIWMEFWTINYSTQRIINIKNNEGVDVPQKFRGSDFKDISLKLKIDINASAEFSESLMMSSLDRFYDKGDLTMGEYAELAPESVISYKEKIKDLVEKKEKLMMEQQQQQTQQNQAMQGQQDEIAQQGQQQEQNVKQEELNKLADFFESLPKEVQAKLKMLPDKEMESQVMNLMKQSVNTSMKQAPQ